MKNIKVPHRPVVYIAGPDVFKPDAESIYKSYAALCEQHGADCLYPSDSEVKPADTREGLACNIYDANIRMLDHSDLVIANVDPYHGPSMDVGASFEMGYATARGIPVLGFRTRKFKSYFERLLDHHGEVFKSDFGFRSKKDGLLLEDFGLSDNLMIAHATGKRVHASFESALKQGLRLYNQKTLQPVAHEKPASEFPVWLSAFDRANDQHEVTMQKLGVMLQSLQQKMSPYWQNLDHVNVLDLACGDGKFSRRLIDLIQYELGTRVRYVAMELNPELARRAQARFPEDKVVQGNIFEEVGGLAGRNFKPHLIIMSHAIYFARDKAAYVRKLANLGGPETLTIYLLNDPIYRDVQKDIEGLRQAFVKTGIPFRDSAPFKSYVYMPPGAKEHLERLRTCPEARDLDEETEMTRRLLCFFQQTPLHELEPNLRHEYLERVHQDLGQHGNKIPVRNHCVLALHPDAPEALREAAGWAVRSMNTQRCEKSDPARRARRKEIVRSQAAVPAR